MNKLTYRQAYDKIIEAYFNDEIKPYHGQFCFCGTLAHTPGSSAYDHNYWRQDDYSHRELDKMEAALLITIMDLTLGGGDKYFTCMDDERTTVINHPNYEYALFEGMSAALDVLKQIHIERGEVIDELPVFAKRELANG